MSPEVFLGAEFDRDIQNRATNSWYGVNGGADTKNEIHAPGVSRVLRAG